ncbi:diacylglycerol O-acyltransferase [Aspergillus luchuensis]|uniref:Diacylglycerol O-acyltransferase n=1 Tax=Aspergillus kawachii TaxID=1069201 RepID=A0A146FF21_ASPKA|nr:diacylglycerol O-acyltransferase [Aspergillus luchuensis]
MATPTIPISLGSSPQHSEGDAGWMLDCGDGGQCDLLKHTKWRLGKLRLRIATKGNKHTKQHSGMLGPWWDCDRLAGLHWRMRHQKLHLFVNQGVLSYF